MQVTILNKPFTIACAAHEERRLEDLAKALEARLQAVADPDTTRRLVLTALALLDETQTTNAALARARGEIERLTDMVVEAQLEAQAAAPDNAERGRVGSLRRVAEGAA